MRSRWLKRLPRLARDDGTTTVKDVLTIAEAHGVTPDELASLTEYQQETDRLRADAARIGPAKFAFQKSIEQVDIIQRWMRVEIEKVKAAAREKLDGQSERRNARLTARMEPRRRCGSKSCAIARPAASRNHVPPRKQIQRRFSAQCRET